MRGAVVIAILTILLAQVIDGRVAVGLGVVAVIGWAVTAPMRRVAGVAVKLDEMGPGLVGGNVGWDTIARQVLRVTGFDPGKTTLTADGRVEGASRFQPYGMLVVESPIMAKLRPNALLPDAPIQLPIVHRDDFRVVADFFQQPKAKAAFDAREVDLLVTYAPKRLGPRGLAMGAEHSMFFAVAAPGALDRYYADPESERRIERVFGSLVYMGSIGVAVFNEE